MKRLQCQHTTEGYLEEYRNAQRMKIEDLKRVLWNQEMDNLVQYAWVENITDIERKKEMDKQDKRKK